MFQYRLDTKCDHYSIYSILKGISVAEIVFNTLGTVLAAWSAIHRVNLVSKIIFFTMSAVFSIIPFKAAVSVYRGEHLSMKLLGILMEVFYRPILKMAKEKKIPILDLSNTFNSYNGSLYISQIEPSGMGGKLIAEGIDHIVKKHDYMKNSKLYSKFNSDSSYTASDNPGYSWNVKYPKR